MRGDQRSQVKLNAVKLGSAVDHNSIPRGIVQSSES